MFKEKDEINEGNGENVLITMLMECLKYFEEYKNLSVYAHMTP
jgi:hypothetical protein